MGELLIRPDFSKLKQYYKFNFEFTDEEEKRVLEHGIRFDTCFIHTEEQAQEFISGFDQIMKTHKIEEHGENIAYLCLRFYEYYWDPEGFFNGYRYTDKKVNDLTYDEKPYFFTKDKQAHEMAKLIDLYNRLKDNDEFRILVEAKVKVESASIEDQRLSKWIIELIINAIRDGDYPIEFSDGIGLFNIGSNGFSWEPGHLNEERIQKAIEKNPKIDHSAKSDKIGEFCEYLLSYLKDIDSLKSKGKIPAKQFKVLNDILILFKIIKKSTKPKGVGRKKKEITNHAPLVDTYKYFLIREKKNLKN